MGAANEQHCGQSGRNPPGGTDLQWITSPSDCETVMDQLYQAYQESHESDPPEIRTGFKDLAELLRSLSVRDNDAVFNLCCSLCTAYEHKAFWDGLQYGAHLMFEQFRKEA